MWPLFLFGAIIIAKEAFQEYKAEKYARRKRHEQDVDFFDFMLSKHPWLFLGVIIFVVILIFGMFSGG